MENNIPKGWVKVKIDEIYDIIKEQGEVGKIPYLEIGNVNIKNKSYSCTEKPSVKGCKISLKNDVLVSRVRPTRGAVAQIVDDEIEVSSAFTIIRNNYKLAEKYLFYYLAWNNEFYNYLGSNCTGTMYPTVAEQFILDFKIPLAPLSEQNRIVIKLDSLMEIIQHNKERLEKIPIILKRFRQSVLSAAVSGKLTEDWREKNDSIESAFNFLLKVKANREKKYNEELATYKKKKSRKPIKDYEIEFEINERIDSWATAKLENLIYIAARIGWRGLKAEEYTKKGPLFLSVYNLNYGEIVDYRDAYRISKERYIESPEIQLRNKDILLCKDGAGIGKLGIVENLPEPATVNSSLLVIRGREVFIPKYFFYFLKGPNLQNLAQQRITGSATPHLFQKDIKEFILDIPPLEEQKEIVRRVEKMFALADTIEARYKKAKDYIDKLPQTVLAKAFRGELVPQDPNDEPAEKLLERIKKEKERNKK
jgi:type I restriction enzyme, S subunit